MTATTKPKANSVVSAHQETAHAANTKRVQGGLLDPRILWKSVPSALHKLNPQTLWRNPVMFIVELGAVWATVLAIIDPTWFAWLIVVWLWLTVLFANLAEAVAEGRGKAQAETLRRAKTQTLARRLKNWEPGSAAVEEQVAAPLLQQGDIVVVEAGEVIPGDGDVVEGIASVDESAITGESAPVIRESGGDRSAVTGGTTVLSDRIVVKVTQKPGESFIDRMIALVEGANRQKTPNEIALNILLAALTIIFVFAVATLQPLAVYSKVNNPGVADTQALNVNGVSGIVMVSLLVCLIPTTIGALLSAIGIAGMDRLVQRNVLAMSGRAVEAAGDVNTLLLDKTGTITLGNRQAGAFIPLDGVSPDELADAAQLSSLSDETPEGRSIVVFAKRNFGLRARTPGELAQAQWVAFSASTRMSGVDLEGTCCARGRPTRSRNGYAHKVVRCPTSSAMSSTASRPAAAPPGGRREPRRQGRGAGRHPSQRRCQARHAGAFRRDAPDGHPHGDDHRRQPVDRQGNCRRGRCRRLPRRGHTRRQARPDQARTTRRQAGGDDRRRHQRRARTGPGRRRGRDEHRHLGGQRGRQHGGSGLRPHQTHRDRRDRQAAC